MSDSGVERDSSGTGAHGDPPQASDDLALPSLSSSATVVAPPPEAARYLILGDSHLFGLFGQHLDQALRDGSTRKVWLYGSCGSSPMTWIKGMETPCGGYVHTDDAPPHKSFERYRTPALSELLSTIKPTHTLVVMGVNFLHFAESTAPHMRQFLDIVRGSGSECTWVGPPEIPDRTLPDGAQVKYHKLIAKLYKVLGAETAGRCKLIDAREIPLRRWDTFDNVHVGPVAARRWSDTVVASLLSPDPTSTASASAWPSSTATTSSAPTQLLP